MASGKAPKIVRCSGCNGKGWVESGDGSGPCSRCSTHGVEVEE